MQLTQQPIPKSSRTLLGFQHALRPLNPTASMAAISAAISSARAAAGQAVHIKIHPRPRTITESREILRVLQSYGEVTMFKNLKVQPNGRQITLQSKGTCLK